VAINARLSAQECGLDAEFLRKLIVRMRLHFAGIHSWCLLFSLGAIASAGGVAADPAISGVTGTVGHGQSITITGTALGTHGNYGDGQTWHGARFLNFRFTDFEDGQIGAHGFFEQSGGQTWVFAPQELGIATDAPPPHSTRYLRRAWKTTRLGGISATISGGGQQFYNTFKFKADANVQAGKFWRLYGGASQNSVFLSAGCPTVSNPTIRGGTECTSGSCAGAQTAWGTGPAVVDGKWHRVEVWVDAASNTFSVSVDGQAAWSQPNWLSSNFAMNGHTVDYPNLIDDPSSTDATCPATGTFNYDDIFIDFTRARVELGDASTWTAVRRKEVQLPTSWSASAVTVRVNAGTFPVGASAYLYVIDGNGAVNANGYPVTVAAAADNAQFQQPNPPLDVGVR
jgi:hypothetical protein